MNAKGRIIATVASLGVMLFSFNHCVLDQKINTSKSGGDQNTSSSSSTPVAENPVPTPAPDPVSPTPTPIADPPPEVIQASEIDVGIKNFEQINETMAVLTGVNPNGNAVDNAFRGIEVQLPTDNSIKSFLAANQVAITKLAAEYCDQLVNSGTLRSQVWPGFNFGGTPNQVLSNNTQRIMVIDQTLNKFWGPALTGDRSTYQLEMLSLIQDLLNNENLSSSNTTQTTMKGVCTAALSTAHVTML